MNREILFRGKRIDNGEWVEGQYITDEKDSVHAYVGYLFGVSNGVVHDTDIVEVIPHTVCRYIGLTDRNGRKIFEGDIVRDIFNSSVVGSVRYGEYRNAFNDDEHGGHIGFYIEWKEKKDLLRKDLLYWVNNSEFIGNIFDNPELMN